MMNWRDFSEIRRVVMLCLLVFFIFRYIFPILGAFSNLIVAYLHHITRVLGG
jgi:hypothetical protein